MKESKKESKTDRKGKKTVSTENHIEENYRWHI